MPMFAYRVGLPGWRIAARLGISLEVVVEVLYDAKANVYVATSEDFLPYFGCVAESPTFEGLVKELRNVIEDAVDVIFGKEREASIIPDLKLSISPEFA